MGLFRNAICLFIIELLLLNSSLCDLSLFSNGNEPNNYLKDQVIILNFFQFISKVQHFFSYLKGRSLPNSRST